MKVKKIVGRTLYIDFYAGFHNNKPDYDKGRNITYIKHRMAKALDPYCSYLGPQRKYQYPEDLKKAIEGYFKSCVGKIYTKNGTEIIDRDTGKPVMDIVKPYTVAGLARHLGLSTNALCDYEKNARIGKAPPEFAHIIAEAKQRIEEFAEGKMYDRDGAKGAEFILRARFNWKSQSELLDEKAKKQRRKLEKEEFELRKAKFEMEQKLLQGDEDNSINIVITRASKPEENEDDE